MSGRKYATIDGKIVAEGDPSARFLVAGEDDDVDDEFVARIKEAAKNVDKAAAAPADKAVRKADNK